MEFERLCMTASDIVISEQKVNDVFLYIGMRLASTKANSNNEGVTAAFIDSVVDNQEVMYKCLPLYVDIKRLKGKLYRSLTHLFDRNTGRFGTTQIGGLCDFRKVEDEYGISLMAEVRIPKRDIDICNAILDLYGLGQLNFSFEISYDPAATVVIDGVRYVDASEHNVLKGVAVVSVPAYRESIALSLVAEDHNEDQPIDIDDEANEIEGYIDDPQGDVSVEEGVVTMTLEEAMKLIAEKDEAIAQKESLIEERDHKIAELESALAEKKENTEEEGSSVDKAEDLEKVTLAEDLQASRILAEEQATAIAEKEEEIAELKAKVEELQAAATELEAIKAAQAEAAKNEKRNQMKSFAERQRLDVNEEAVASAIADLNYEAIVTLANKASADIDANRDVTISNAFAGDSMKLKSRFGNLLDRKN